jgi:hypothetical protein
VITLPTWLVVVLGLASPVVALVAIVAAALTERSRRKHDQKMQRVELEAQRLSKLRDDRLQAYSTLSRLTKVIRPTPPEKVTDVVEILSEIELLADDPQLLDSASKLVALAGKTRIAAWRLHQGRATQSEVDSANDKLTECRREFIQLANKELTQGPATARD